MKTYSKFSSLNTHAYRYHKERLQDCSLPSPSVPVRTLDAVDGVDELTDERAFWNGVDDVGSDASKDLVGIQPGENSSRVDDIEISGKELERNSALLLLKLKEGHAVSQVAIDSIVEGCGHMFELFTKNVEHVAAEHLTAAGVDKDFLAHAFSQVPKPFENLKTKYRQEKFFVQEFGMIVSYV